MIEDRLTESGSQRQPEVPLKEYLSNTKVEDISFEKTIGEGQGETGCLGVRWTVGGNAPRGGWMYLRNSRPNSLNFEKKK